MEEAQIVEDVEAPPLSESMQRNIDRGKTNETSLSEISESMQLETSPLSEAQIILDLEASLQRELNTLWGNANEAENFTIFRTPHNISKRKKNLFQPSVISIGPFHRGQKHLRAMEEQKRRFLRDFLSRGDHISLNLCILGMKSLEERTRRCYSEKFDDLKSMAFVEMMLLDGCFVLEYFLKKRVDNWNSILEVGWNSDFIDRDLLLQENQIPFFIVDKLHELIGFNQESRISFVKFIAFSFWAYDSVYLDPPTEIPDPPAEIHHLVHLYYHYLVPNPGIPVVLSSKLFDLTKMFRANRIIKDLLHWFCSRPVRSRTVRSRTLPIKRGGIQRGLLNRFRSWPVRRRSSPDLTSQSLPVALLNSTRNISSMVIPSATELKQKGVKFTPKTNSKDMLDISFEYGVLKIPRLKITDFTKPIFANLLAFEQTKYGKNNSPFTRFVAFLDNLINTPNDVTILQECGIIETWIGSEEELAHFINLVTEGAGYGDNHYLARLYMEVNKYIGSSWNRNRAKLLSDYFRNPWATISVVAAFILLVLTLIQSFFAVFAYFRPPSS